MFRPAGPERRRKDHHHRNPRRPAGATSGEVTILGQTWQITPRELRERMGISLQETRLSEKLTVLETLKLFSGFYRQPRARRTKCWSRCNSARRPMPGSANFPAARSSGWQWHGAGGQSQSSVSGRTHHRAGSPKPPPALGHHPRFSRPGHSFAHHALHGRSRASVRSPGHRRSRTGDRRRHPGDLIERLGGHHMVEFQVKRVLEQRWIGGLAGPSRS